MSLRLFLITSLLLAGCATAPQTNAGSSNLLSDNPTNLKTMDVDELRQQMRQATGASVGGH